MLRHFFMLVVVSGESRCSIRQASAPLNRGGGGRGNLRLKEINVMNGTMPGWEDYSLGIDISESLSRYNNTDYFESGDMGKLTSKTNGAVWLDEIKTAAARDHDFYWCLVSVKLSPENQTISTFTAYGLNGEHLAHANFLIWWGSVAEGITVNGTKFHSGPCYPTSKEFVTDAASGYIVGLNVGRGIEAFPYERLGFGLYNQGGEGPHQGIEAAWRLRARGLENREGEYIKPYPNDIAP